MLLMLSIACIPVYASSPGDVDGDGDFDLVDIAQLQVCFGKPLGAGDPDCERFDIRPDRTITLADYAVLVCGLGGPGVVRSPVQFDVPDSPTARRSVFISGTAIGVTRVEIFGGTSDVVVPVTQCAFLASIGLNPNALNHLLVSGRLPDGTLGAPTPIEVLQDEQPPNLFIDFPTSQSEITTDVTDVAGRVGDTLSGFLGLTVTVNDQPAVVDVGIGTNGTFFLQDVPLALGENVIGAVATDAVGNTIMREISVTRIEIPPGSAEMAVLSGNAQLGPAGSVLTEPLVVRVMNTNGKPLSGKLVTFDVTRSNGRLRADDLGVGALMLQMFTDENGEASAFLQLGSDAGCGNNRVQVSSRSIAGTVAFCASALPAPAAQINIGSGNNQRAEAGGSALESLRVWVNDACNGVPGIPVTFSVVAGGGKIDGREEVIVITEVTGHAEIPFTLGSEAGNNLVQADFAGNQTRPAIFNIVGIARNEQLASLTGIVLNNADQPIQGATCALTVDGSALLPQVTDINGIFRFDAILKSGRSDLTILGATAFHVGGIDGIDIPAGSYPALHFEPVIIPNAPNVMPSPVLLPALDSVNAVPFDNTQDVELTVAGIEGLKMTVKAGSMTLADGSIPSIENPTTLSLNLVRHDDVPMPMPDGVSPPFAWTLQPGGATFDPPIEIVYPNLSALPAGSVAYFLSFNHDTMVFEIVATGTVTVDGLCIVTDPGSGITVSGWGCNCPPYSVTGDCCSCGGGCTKCEGGACVSICNRPCFDCIDGVCVSACGDAECAGGECDDGNGATGGDACVITGAFPPTECHGVVPEGGCFGTIQGRGEACDDGDPCTENGICADNACSGARSNCLCDGSGGKACDSDGLGGSCVGGECVAPCRGQEDGAPCGIPSEGQCVGGACLSGECQPSGVASAVAAGDSCCGSANGAACDTGDPCDEVAECGNGQCEEVLRTCGGDTGCFCGEGQVCAGDRFCLEDCAPPGDMCSEAGDDCVLGFCLPSVCEERADGEPCETADPCLGLAQCSNGHCQSIAAACGGDTGCTCPEGQGCALDQFCVESCSPPGDPCSEPGEDCIQGFCTPSVCSEMQNGETCDTGDPCQTDGVCRDGGCNTIYKCGSDTGCSCSEGQECISDSLCLEVCAPPSDPCSRPGDDCTQGFCLPSACGELPDGASCDTGDPCQAAGACRGGQCEIVARSCSSGTGCSCPEGQGCAADTLCLEVCGLPGDPCSRACDDCTQGFCIPGGCCELGDGEDCGVGGADFCLGGRCVRCQFASDCANCEACVDFSCAVDPNPDPCCDDDTGTGISCGGSCCLGTCCPLTDECCGPNTFCCEDGAGGSTCCALGLEQCCDGVCTPICDALACNVCDGAGGCESTCDLNSCERVCIDGTCESDCNAAQCKTCDGSGTCVTICDSSACMDGSCIDGVCLSRCQQCESCQDGVCVPDCDLNNCEQACVDDVCVSSCDANQCLVCDGNGSCVSTCDASMCQVCDGSGQCVDSCEQQGNCTSCDGAGACVFDCDATLCEGCDGQGQCVFQCEDRCCNANDCESCLGGVCDTRCDPGQCLACNGSGQCVAECSLIGCDCGLCEICNAATGLCDPDPEPCCNQPDNAPCGECRTCFNEVCGVLPDNAVCVSDPPVDCGFSSCQGGACTPDPSDCSTLDDECNIGQCDVGSGQCLPVSRPNGTPCTDLDPCTDDECQDGFCVSTPIPGCP